LHEELQLPATARVSFYLYNQPWEVDLFVDSLLAILSAGRKTGALRP
jgi:selenocysteine lyase/cysteine desulfurase